MNPLDFAFILLRNTPWWVFLIFAWLLWLGWRGLRTRAVRLPLLAIDPALLLALTVPDLVQRAGGAEWRQIGVWIGAAALGAAVGHITLRHLRLRALPEKRSIIVPGSVIPLAVYMAVFAKNYYFGYLFRRYPGLQNDAETALLQLALGGAFAGIMIGRVATLLLAFARTRSLAHSPGDRVT